MNDCDTISGRLSMDLDHLLSPAESAELEADLARCPTYGPLAQAMRDTDRMLRAESMLAPRRDLWHDIVAQIELSQQRRDQRLVGITFVLGGFLSLWPLVVLGAFLVLAVLVAVQPGLASGFVDFIVDSLGQLYALTLAFGAVQKAVGAWVLPLLAAMASLFLLTLSIVWAQRLTAVRSTAVQALPLSPSL